MRRTNGGKDSKARAERHGAREAKQPYAAEIEDRETEMRQNENRTEAPRNFSRSKQRS